jgi:predicted RNA polymerase sigma factor
MLPEAHAFIDAVYRSDWGRIVATVIRFFGDFDVAEDAAQEAFAAAVSQWLVSGVPEAPHACIIETALRKAVDRPRRRARFGKKSRDAQRGSEVGWTVAGSPAGWYRWLRYRCAVRH